MRVRLALMCAIVAILASQPAHALSGGSVVLKRKYKQGSIFFRRVEMDILMTGDDSGSDRKKEAERILVKAVARDGTVKLAKIVDEDMGGILSGIFTTGRSMLMNVDGLGRVLSLQAYDESTDETLLPASPDLTMMEQMREVLLPGKPVRIGETWETKVGNFKVKGENFIMRTTLRGLEKNGTKRLWHVKQTAAMSEGNKPNADVIICRAQFWLDADTNITVSSEVKIESSSGSVTIRTYAVEGGGQ